MTDDDLPILPDDYVGAWLLPDVLRQRNKELEKYGRRICRWHQGPALPLTDEYFYRTGCGDGFRKVCKKCKTARTVERSKERYQTDPEFVAHRNRMQELDRKRHRKARNAANAQRQRVYRRRLKREGLARVLGVSA